MKADEALKQSPDGFIWLHGKSAYMSYEQLIWNQYTSVSMSDILSDQWQPCKPKLKCMACEEIKLLMNNISPSTKELYQMQIHHLKYHHCTCEK